MAAAVLALWFIVGVSTGTSQWGDHFEQFVWAHGIEWGYHKHPPLPTWILAALIGVFGPAVGWAQLLGLVCTLGTGFFTYRVARELFSTSMGALALFFWGLQQPFSDRSHLFNHNSVLMLGISAAAWSILLALRQPRRLAGWVGLGLLAGLSLLAKYQAVVPLAGLAMAAWLSGELDSKHARRGLSCSALLAIVVLVPHALWIVNHGFTPVQYALQPGESLSWSGRLWSVTSFLGQQVRIVLPALLLAGLFLWLPRLTGSPSFAETFASSRAAAKSGPLTRRQRAWLIGLVAFPLCATVLVSPLFGLKLQNHWGYQALQFGSVWLAWTIRPHTTLARPAWIAVALLMHVLFMALAVSLPPAAKSRQDAQYPARQLAEAVRRDWQDDSPCPLAIIVGSSFESGIVSVYNGGTAVVLEDGEHSKSPWITPLDVREQGAVYISSDRGQLPTQGVTRVGYLDVGTVSAAPRDRVFWAVVPPETCAMAE